MSKFVPFTISKKDFWPVARQLKPGLTKKQYEAMWERFYAAMEQRAKVRASMKVIRGGRA